MSHSTRLILTGAVVVVLALLGVVPLWASGYILGVLTVAYYFSVFAMAWDCCSASPTRSISARRS